MAKETKSVAPGDKLIRFADGTELSAGNVRGEATLWSAEDKSERLFDVPADEDTSAEFRRGLDALGIVQQQSLHLDIDDTADPSGPGAARKRQSVVLRPPDGGMEPSVQVVLFQDESGGLSWHFPDGFFDGAREEKPGRVRFTIPTRTLAAREAVRKGLPFRLPPQGPFTKQGRNVFKVLLVPTSGAADVLASFDERRHGYDLRGVSAEDYGGRQGVPFSDWRRLAAGPSLLVIHDLFSSVAGMLSGMPPDDVATLCASYDGRVVGFDHPAAAQTPEQNARFLIETLNRHAPDSELTFDVLAHGRGALVARTLAERGARLGGDRLHVRKILMAGAPNRGTPIAEPDKLHDLLNVLTNLHADFAEGPALYPLETLLALAAQLARNPRERIPGIAAMTPDYVSDALNSVEPPAALDYAYVTADFEPDPAYDNAFLTSTFKGEVAGRVFAAGNTKAQNDLLVPTAAADVYPQPRALLNVLAYDADEHVSHAGYFGLPKTFELMSAYFGLRGQTPGAAVLSNDTSTISGEAGSAAEKASDARPETVSVDRDADGREGLLGGSTQRGRRGRVRTGRADKSNRGLLGGLAGKDSASDSMLGKRRRGVVLPGRRKSLDAETAADRTGEDVRWPTWEQPSPSPRPVKADASAGVSGEVSIQRAPTISLPEAVNEGQTIDVTVSLREWSAGGSATGPVSVVMPAAVQEVSVVVRLEAAGFEFVGGETTKTIRVRRTEVPRDESVTFKLKALSPGRLPAQRRVVADFWQNNSNIGWVGADVVVNPAATEAQPAPAPYVKLAEPARTPCELLLFINQCSELLVSHNNFYHFKHMGQVKFNHNELADKIQTYISPHINSFPQGGTEEELEKWRGDFGDTLVGMGGWLWTLLPEKFREEYFRLGDDVRSIWVHSEDMVFPWELARPFREGDEPKLTLGQRHVIGRWLQQLDLLPSPQQMRVEKIAILSPKYEDESLALPWSGEESEQLRGLFPRGVMSVGPINAENVKRRVLDSTDVQLLHFTGHGDANELNSDLNYLMLEDKRLEAVRFGQTRLGPAGHPFLVLNACSVGVVKVELGQAAGFPATCLRGGFSGLVAPLWPVPDRSAMDFSLRLYRKLLQRRSIGEALSEVRRDKPDDPTYQAYTFFGDPWARLLFT